MADSYLDGLILTYVATSCVSFQLKCREYAVLRVYVQNRNKKYMDKNRTKPFKMDKDLGMKNCHRQNHWNKAELFVA